MTKIKYKTKLSMFKLLIGIHAVFATEKCLVNSNKNVYIIYTITLYSPKKLIQKAKNI